MRCLVTGASGHLGSHLAALLVESGHLVTALVRPSSDLWRLSGILDRIQLVRTVDEIPREAFETVFHLAWAGVTAPQRDLPQNIVANITGSLRLFQLAQAADCKCWIGIGSQAEYGRVPDMVLTEDLTPRPNTAYGAAKLCLANLLEVLCRQAGIRFVWLRLTAAYGPKDDPAHLIPSVIESFLSGECPSLTSGAQQWDYLYVDDAVRAMYETAIAPGVGGIFNLAAGEASTVQSIVQRIRDMVDPSLPVRFGQEMVASLRADSANLQKATGWRPQTNLDAGLRKTLDWHESIRLHS